jgi:hypothetical protein
VGGAAGQGKGKSGKSASAAAVAAAAVPPLATYNVALASPPHWKPYGNAVFATAANATTCSLLEGDTITGIRFWATLRRGALMTSNITADAYVAVHDVVPYKHQTNQGPRPHLAFCMTLLEADGVEESCPAFGSQEGVPGLWLLAPDVGDGTRSLRASGDAALAVDAATYERAVRDVHENPLRADDYAHAECMSDEEDVESAEAEREMHH